MIGKCGLASIAVVLGAMLMVAPAQAASSSATDIACQKHISRYIKGAPRSDVPAACWRVGPLVLGMSEADLSRILGVADQTATVAGGLNGARNYSAKLYAFPRSWRSDLQRRPQGDVRLRFVEVLLFQGHVVQIANDPGARIGGPNCTAQGRLPGVKTGGEPADFRPFQRFAGIRIGMTVGELSQRFGAAPGFNRSKDWSSYLPTPLTFDFDPDHGRISGFAIGTDDDAVTVQAEADMRVSRDPRTCRINDVSFQDSAGR